RTAIYIAAEIKRRWLLSEFNKRRIREGKVFYDLAIGIHCGNVMITHHPGTDRPFNAEGYAINLAKRIETKSRDGELSRIMISKNVFDRTAEYSIPVQAEFRGDVELRGMYGSCPIYELSVYGEIEQPEGVRQ